MLILITSHPSHISLRQSHRTSLNETLLNKLNAKRLFLLAQTIHEQNGYKQVPQYLIENENSQNMDILQFGFAESYHNLTYKHLMGLKWTNKYCSQAKFVLKMDDDIIVDVFQLERKLKEYETSSELLLGYIQEEMKPLRESDSKWHVGLEEYNLTRYPSFLSGWAYVTNTFTIGKLLKHIDSVPYFWIDDVYVTGFLAMRSNINHTKWNKYYTTDPGYLSCCISMKGSDKYECDYIVGPSGRNEELVISFLKHAFHCYTTGCKRRKKELSTSCVLTNDPTHPKGKGTSSIVYLTSITK